MRRKQMKLGVFLMGAGHHIASWRFPEAPADAFESIDFYIKAAHLAESGKLDMLFISDALSLNELGHPSELVRFEPLTLIAALSTATSKIGLAATASTTYNEPFHIARKFASLDHLSKGRAAWNVVTSYYEEEAGNFGLNRHPSHQERYERAQEFVQVVQKLWDSWEKDALVRNKQKGIYYDKSKLHEINHEGKYFSVRGPLNASAPPQGRPVLIQAGSSADGIRFASQFAEVIFTAQQTLEQGQAFYRDVKAQASLWGRNPEHVLVLPGVSPIIGATEREAREQYEHLQELIVPEIAQAFLSDYLGGLDLSQYDLDSPLPEVIPETNGNQSRRELIIELARRERLTIRELSKRIAGSRGHRMIYGSPSQIADQLQIWFEEKAADGFNLMFPYYPGLLEKFVGEVVPELQERGIFRTEYNGNQLRDHLELPAPIPSYTQKE